MAAALSHRGSLAVVIALASAAIAFAACSQKDDPAPASTATPMPPTAGVTAITIGATPSLPPDRPAPPPPGQTPPPGGQPPGPPPPPGAQGVASFPWNRDVVMSRSRDGLAFQLGRIAFERAGVPQVIRDSGGRLVATFQWFPFDSRAAFDRVAISTSNDDGGTWSVPRTVAVDGLPAGMMRPFDPTIVQLADGRFRLYFTSGAMTSGARPGIYSAISASLDSFTFEPGARFAPEAGTVDASVVWFKEAWHLIAHTMEANTGRGFHATSADGLTFLDAPMLDVGRGRQWIGNATVAGSQLRYYGSGMDGAWSAVSSDGATWQLESGTRGQGGDLSVVQLGDGSWLMLAVGPVRVDAGPSPFTGP